MRGAAINIGAIFFDSNISIHAPLAWRGYPNLAAGIAIRDFNPRATCVARHILYGAVEQRRRFQSTRHLRGAATSDVHPTLVQTISIHAPLAWRGPHLATPPVVESISIHAPLAWRGWSLRNESPHSKNFNPRATCVARPNIFCSSGVSWEFQSTRHLRGAAPRKSRHVPTPKISIHAPLAWRGIAMERSSQAMENFNPRATCVARHVRITASELNIRISIHAPLAWRGRSHSYSPPYTSNFNPRATCVARPRRDPANHESPKFQSTRHLRGAAEELIMAASDKIISIHAPLAWRGFQGSSPFSRVDISIHAPLAWRGGIHTSLDFFAARISIHAPLAWRGMRPVQGLNIMINFNPRATFVARLELCRVLVIAPLFQSTRHLRGAAA